MRKKIFALAVYLLLLGPAAGAFAGQTDPPGDNELKISTTTSVENSGLLKVLMPRFEELFGYLTKVIPVGTGAALKMAERGDVDVVIVHSKPAEEQFVAAGHGVNRRKLWVNDFIIVGPAEDPAGVARAGSAAEALKLIAGHKSLFISRGDNSGTHDRERSIWKLAGIEPQADWYIEAGSGMGAVLTMADQRCAYTLTDRGTYLAFKGKIDLPILHAGDDNLKNVYSIIAVNPAEHPRANYFGAMALIAWLSSPAGQKLAAEYTMGGEKLFKPLAVTRFE